MEERERFREGLGDREAQQEKEEAGEQEDVEEEEEEEGQDPQEALRTGRGIQIVIGSGRSNGVVGPGVTGGRESGEGREESVVEVAGGRRLAV